MIFIVVKHPVRPEYADIWVSLVEEFTAATRAEPGNIFFDLFRSLEDSNLYVLVEAFQDAAAGEAHVNSSHFQAAISQLPKWLSAVPEIINIEVPSEGWSRMSEMQIEVGGSLSE
jgi:quinol monooxygenase YgiN